MTVFLCFLTIKILLIVRHESSLSMVCIDLRSNCMEWSMGAAQSSTPHRTLYPTEHSRGRVPRFHCGRADTEFDVEFDAGIFRAWAKPQPISTLTRYHTATLVLIVPNVRHESSLMLRFAHTQYRKQPRLELIW